jgi:DNA polymerase I
MVKVPTNDIEAAYKLSSGLEEKINMALDGVVKIKLESIFKSILIMAKKRYAGVSLEKHGDEWKEKIVMKGIETIRRDWCDLTSESLLNVLKMILSEEDPKKALLYMRGVINDLKSNKIPIEKLVITKSMSKSMGSYKGVQPHIEVVKKMRKRDPYGAPGMGDRIGYVIIRGKEMMSERAEDPEYVKAHKLLIDPKYYIENQILPPIERVFESIGIQKSEIVGKGRQLALNSLIPQKL